MSARTAIPQLAVYVWMNTKDEHEKLYCYLAITLIGRYFATDFRENESAAVNAVLDEYGPLEVLKRFVAEIEDRHGNIWRKQTRLQMLTLFRLFAFRERCTPHLKDSGIILALNGRLCNLEELEGSVWDFWWLSSQTLV